ncbi:hypothetical protein JVU11DRAFT_8167 [Chiua virens]|nr:hypothetical protein JVU11DRAFT_8167 [Chiua virens]
MMLRVWVIYSRSRRILLTLLTLLSMEIISMLAVAVFYSNSSREIWFAIQVLGYSFCGGQLTSQSLIWEEVTDILQMTFGAVLCILAIIQFARESFQMYHATKQWQPNRYVRLLTEQGIVYFFAIFLVNVISVLSYWGELPSTGWLSIFVAVLQEVPVFILAPRFIISIREMYAHDARRGTGIDNGFGLSASSSFGGVSREPVVFAPGVQSEVAVHAVDADGEENQNEGTENIELVPREAGSTQPV